MKNWDTIQQALRILMVSAGSMILVSKGYMAAEELEKIVGALLVIGPAGWWAFWEWKRKREKSE